MRIVLYPHNFPTFSETFIVRQFLYLLKQGVDVHIVAKKSDDLHLFPEIKPYIKTNIHFLPDVSNKMYSIISFPYIFLKTFIHSPKNVLKYFIMLSKQIGILRTIKKFYSEYPIINLKPDLIHFEFTSIAREHYHLKDIVGYKVVTSFRGYGITRSHLEDPTYYTETFNRLDGIHSISKHLIEHAYKYRNLSQKIPYKIIPPAIDKKLLTYERRYRTSNGITEPVRILTVARFHWSKGYEYILKALHILKGHDLKFEYHIVGDGPLKDMLIYLIHTFNLAKVVKIMGKLPFEKTLKEYLWADIFVIGSLTEGFCNAVLEAQALGLPSVVTNAPALLENVEKDITALVAERRNPEDIADKLKVLITSPEKRKELGINARERAQKFLLDKQADEFYKFYSYILSL